MSLKKQHKGNPKETARNFAICRIRDLEDRISIYKIGEWFDMTGQRVQKILEDYWDDYIKYKRSQIKKEEYRLVKQLSK